MAPGGPPEGQCKEEQEMVCYTTYDDPFRTRGSGAQREPTRSDHLGRSDLTSNERRMTVGGRAPSVNASDMIVT